MTTNPVWPNELMIRDTGIVPDDGGGRIYTTVGFGYLKEKYIRATLVERWRSDLEGAQAALKQDQAERDKWRADWAVLYTEVGSLKSVISDLEEKLARCERALAEAKCTG